MKIIFSSSVVGNDENIIDRVKAELRATDATFNSRQVDQRHTVFTGIVWDNMGMGIGTDPFWTLEVMADSQSGSLRLWARSTYKIPDDERDQVEQVLRRQANRRAVRGTFKLGDDSNVVRYSTPPVRLEDLDYGLRGAFEGIDDLLASTVTPALRKALHIDG